jgi:hypothetical protein
MRLRLVKGHLPPIPSAFSGSPGASIIHQHSPHLARCNRVKMPTILPVCYSGIDKPQIRFVDKCRGLEGMAAFFASHVMVSSAVEFVVDERNQPLQRLPIASAPGLQELGDFTNRLLHFGFRPAGLPLGLAHIITIPALKKLVMRLLNKAKAFRITPILENFHSQDCTSLLAISALRDESR